KKSKIWGYEAQFSRALRERRGVLSSATETIPFLLCGRPEVDPPQEFGASISSACRPETWPPTPSNLGGRSGVRWPAVAGRKNMCMVPRGYVFAQTPGPA
ncbi:unnamed protein product, partial [Hapterophycus canaliculatus]